MPIINKGILDIGTVSLRQTGNDWPTAQVTTTSDVVEVSSNLYFTNARVVSAVTSFVSTSNVAEGTNQYFTNARVISAVTPYLTTSNVVEDTNQYFTNARVTANLQQQSVNVFADVDITGITTDGILIWNGTKFVASTIAGEATSNIALVAYQADHANTADSSNVANSVLSLSNFTTANLLESNTNLYYTNSRARSAFTAGQSIIIEANGRISANVTLEFANLNATIANITTNNVTEGNQNLYFTNARVITAVTSYLTTANVTESNSNLYYTNARVLSALTGNLTIGNLVTGTSVSNSYTTAGNVTAGNVIASGIGIFGSGAGGVISGANLISANNIQGINWLGLYTANVIESSSVLYYTNTRVNSFIQPYLTTANVTELNNLYYTNARVISAVLPYLTTSNVAEGGNLYYTNARVISAVLPYLTTSNVAEGSNLYYTNARVLSALTGNVIIGNATIGSVLANTAFFGSGTGGSMTGANLLSATNIQANTWLGLYTSNVIEGINQYFTNARVYSNVIALLPTLAGSGIAIQANGQISANAAVVTFASISQFLTTSNIAEGSNLYYTNARVLSALTGNVTIGNLAVNTSTANSYTTAGNVTAGNVIASGIGIFGSGTGGVISGANLISANNIVTGTSVSNSYITAGNVTAGNVIANSASFGSGFGGSITGANLISANNIQGINWLGLYSANVIENTNLYFTNARVYSNVIALLPTLAGSGIAIQANGQISASAQSVSLATLAPFLTTSNVSEGSNLYYTNARVLSALTGNVTIGNLAVNTSTANSYTTTGNVNAGNVIANTLIIGSTSGGSLSGLNLISTNNIIANTFTVGSVSGGSLTGPNLISANNIQSNIWLGLYTSNVIEGINQYFTNARVYANVIALVPTLAGSGIQIQANGQINASAQSISLATLAPFLTTSNVSEGSNLYYTNARVLSALTGNVAIGNVIATTLVLGSVSGGSLTGPNLISANNIQSNIWLGLYTSNVIEGINQYFTNARVLSALTGNLTIGNLVTGTSVSNSYVTAGNVTAGNVIATILVLGSATGGSVTGANLLSANNIQGINWLGLYTSNVIEGINQYFTNARVYSNVIALLPTLAGQNITIAANGQINSTASGTSSITSTSNVSEGSNLYYTNARVLSALTGNLTIGNLVTGTSVSNSYITAGNVNAGNVIATTLVLGSAIGGSITGANLLSANNIQGINWLGLYTSNVIESSSALYYTNARVLSALTGNVTIGNAIISSVTANSAFFGSGTGGSITGANLLSANNIQGINWLGLYTSNVIESSSNLYFTNARVYSNVIALLPTLAGSGIQIQANGQINASAQSVSLATLAPFLTTSNVAEGSNLYYTNARVLSALTGNVTIGNLVTGTSVSNSYVTAGNITAGNIIANTLLVGSASGGSLTGLNLLSTNNIIANTFTVGSVSGGSLTGPNLISANNIQSNIWLGLYTANVIEFNNLYFTNSRVYSNVIALLPTLAGQNITIAANGQINSTASGTVSLSGLTTSNLAEGVNLYYTNARVLSALTGNLTIGNLVTGTSVSNSYITAGNVTAGNVIATGTLLFGSGGGGAITGANLISANNIVTGTSVSNSYVTAGNVTAGNIIATGTVLFGSGGGGAITGANLLSANNVQGINWLGLYSSNVIESSSALYYTNSRVYSNVIALLPTLAGQNITIAANGQINSTASGSSITSTSNVSEGSNLYYTNARVLSALTGNITIGNLVTGTSVSNSYVTAGNVTAGNVIATGTLLFGSGAGGSIVGANLISANNIVSGTSVSNSYTTVGNVTAGNVIATGTTVFGSGGGGSIVGANLISANNIVANTAVFGTGIGGSVTGANLISATTILSNTWLGLYTANVIESSSALYYTNTRVNSNVIAFLPSLAGSGIQIQANGQINASAQSVSLATLAPFLTTSNVAEGSNLYYTNARVYSNVIALLAGNVTIGNVSAGSVVFGTGIGGSVTGANLISATTILANTWNGLYTANVIESASNLYFTNARVVSALTGNVTIGNVNTISVQANIWTGLYTANVIESASNLYFSNARVLALVGGAAIYRPYIATFRGNSQVTTLNLPVTPANNNYVTVIINGVTQLSNAYTLSGNVITLSGAPATNADIDVRIVEVGQNLTKDFNSRLFYGNNVANTTLISNNFTDSSILVFENGVAQVPGVDYSVNNGLLRFTTPPASNVIVEIRELPTLNGTGTYVGGQNIQILANNQINATVQEQIHPFLLSLL